MRLAIHLRRCTDFRPTNLFHLYLYTSKERFTSHRIRIHHNNTGLRCRLIRNRYLLHRMVLFPAHMYHQFLHYLSIHSRRLDLLPMSHHSRRHTMADHRLARLRLDQAVCLLMLYRRMDRPVRVARRCRTPELRLRLAILRTLPHLRRSHSLRCRFRVLAHEKTR